MSSVHFLVLGIYQLTGAFRNYRWLEKEIIPKNYLESPEEAEEDDQEALVNHLYQNFQ